MPTTEPELLSRPTEITPAMLVDAVGRGYAEIRKLEQELDRKRKAWELFVLHARREGATLKTLAESAGTSIGTIARAERLAKPSERKD